MDTANNTFPIELHAGEQIKYTHPNVKVTIKGDDEIVLVHGSLTLTTSRVLYIQSLPRKICIFFKYQNCVTHAIDKQNLVCMISDLQDTDPFLEEDEEEANKPADPTLEKIQTVDSLESDQWIQLAGNYQVLFHYGELGQEKLKEVFKIFSECSTMNPDENQSGNILSMLSGDFITSANMNRNGQENQDDDEFEAEEGGYEDDDEGLGEMQARKKKVKGEKNSLNTDEQEFTAEAGGYEDDDEGLGGKQQGSDKIKREDKRMNVE